MNFSSPEKEIKNMFNRVANSLSDSRSSLDITRKILKKAVLRLASTATSDDGQVNAVLDDIKISAISDVNIDVLDTQLDKLLILTNRSEYQQKITIETEFYSSLKHSLDEFNCTEACTSIINKLVGKKLSDKDISMEILKLINDTTLR